MWANFKGILTAISAIREIFSMLGKAWDKFKEAKRLKTEEKIRRSVDTAIDSRDQTGFEESIGSDNAGLPTKIRPPSMGNRPSRDRSKP